jgi:hypothetical protein
MLPHPIIRVTSCRQVGPFTLNLEFDDGGSQTIDFEPVLFGEIFEPLRDPQFFAQVKIDPACHTLIWPNDADFDPATLRYWPEYLPYMLKDAEQWKNAAASQKLSA